MPCANKKASKVVVRPLARGSSSEEQVVLQLERLNVRGPVEVRQLPTPPPWKQASRPRHRDFVCTRRNAGRDDGRTWMARRYLCGSELDEGACVQDQEDQEQSVDPEDDIPPHCVHKGRVEIAIMDIAKPMKPRGLSKDYEVVDSVSRVIALEDDQEWEWNDVSMDEDDGWESVEAIKPVRRSSYASVLQRRT